MTFKIDKVLVNDDIIIDSNCNIDELIDLFTSNNFLVIKDDNMIRIHDKEEIRAVIVFNSEKIETMDLFGFDNIKVELDSTYVDIQSLFDNNNDECKMHIRCKLEDKEVELSKKLECIGCKKSSREMCMYAGQIETKLDCDNCILSKISCGSNSIYAITIKN